MKPQAAHTPRHWSLSARLGWRLAAVMLLAIMLASAAVVWRILATVHGLDDLALQNQAQLILDRLPAIPPDNGSVPLPDDLVSRFRFSDGDNIFLVYAGNRLVGTSDPRAAADIAEFLPQRLAAGVFRLPVMHRHRHGMVGMTVEQGPWQVVVLQGHEQTGVLLESIMGRFVAGLLWLLLPIGVVTVIVGELTLRRGLRPLRDVSAAAARIRPGLPGSRLPVAGLPSEVAPLVGAMNEALARLEQALTTQRRFMADAAHALRTPLAVLTARLDLLDQQPEAEALRGDADRMGRMVGQLLRMARLEGSPLDVTQSVDLHAVAVEAISGLAPLAYRRGMELALLDGPPVAPIRGNHEALLLALTNLIENALSHAPAGSEVDVAVTQPAVLTVRDRGPGVPAELRESIFTRFERGPHAKPGGVGLGLAIVAEIAAAHGGKASATAREGGGAIFTMTLAN